MTTDQLDAAIAATQRLAASTAHRLALEHLVPDDATPAQTRTLVAAILDDAGREIVMCEETIATLRAKRDDLVREIRQLAELAGVQNVDALGDSVIVQRAAIAIGQTTTQLAAELERNRALDGEVAKLRARVAELEAETRVSDQRLADQHDKWSARVAKLEARPVLTVERLAEALTNTTAGDTFAKMASDMMERLGAVTLPAQDRGQDIWTAYLAVVDNDVDRDGNWQARALTRALANLGAPEKSPAADVFAAVSVNDLVGVIDVAYVKKLTAGDDSLECSKASARAVLDFLRAKLVAPVDPEVVARALVDDASSGPRWCDIDQEWRRKRIATMRDILDANGIPVTPEPGK